MSFVAWFARAFECVTFCTWKGGRRIDVVVCSRVGYGQGFISCALTINGGPYVCVTRLTAAQLREKQKRQSWRKEANERARHILAHHTSANQ